VPENLIGRHRFVAVRLLILFDSARSGLRWIAGSAEELLVYCDALRPGVLADVSTAASFALGDIS
jgi:hypothetical protein